MLELHAHSRIADQILHLSLERECHIEHVERQPKIRARIQQLAARDVCSQLGNLIDDAGSMLHSFGHFGLAFHVEPRVPAAVRLLGGNQATKVAPVQALRTLYSGLAILIAAIVLLAIGSSMTIS